VGIRAGLGAPAEMTTSGPLVLKTTTPGNFRLPSPGHPVPRRANRIRGPSRPVRGSHLAPHADETTAEIHDLPRPAHGSSCRIPAKCTPGYTSLGCPEPCRSLCTLISGKTGDQPVWAVTHPGAGRILG